MRDLAILILVAASIVATPARATPAADRASAAGQQAYKEGRFADAAHEFEAAYAADPRPQYLFNIAQAYRFAKQCAQAAIYYRLFLEQVKNAEHLDKVRGYLAEMDACAAQPAPVEPAPQPPAPPPQPPPAVTARATLAPAPIATDRGAGLRRAGWIAGGAGLAAVAAGVVFHVQLDHASSERAQLVTTCNEAAGPPPTSCNAGAFRAIDDRGHRDAALAATGYAVGGAVLITGVALYFLGRGGEHAVAVTPLPGGAMASLGGAF